MKTGIATILVVLSAGYAGAQHMPPVGTPQKTIADSSQQIADKIIKSKKPVVVDFWAAWCGPCRMLDPVLAGLEKKYKGKVEFIKVDVDRHRQIAGYFRVQGIPAVFIVSDSAVRNAIVGFRPEAEYKAAIDGALANSASNKKKAVPDTTAGSLQKEKSGGEGL